MEIIPPLVTTRTDNGSEREHVPGLSFIRFLASIKWRYPVAPRQSSTFTDDVLEVIAPVGPSPLTYEVGKITYVGNHGSHFRSSK